MRDALFIATKDVRYMLLARETFLWVFVMPIVFFYFIGTVTGGFGTPSSAGEPDPIVVAAGTQPGFLAQQLEHRLADRNFEVVSELDGEGRPRSAPRVELPNDFTARVLAGETATVRYTPRSSGELSGDYDRLRVGRAVFTVLADLVVAGELGRVPTAESFAELNATPRALTVAVAPAGERQRIPTGFEQAVPGIMVMFTLLVLATSGAVLMVVERRQGLLRRLAATPIARRDVVLGKWLGKMALGLVQIAFAMLAGTVLFRMDWGPDLGAVVLVMLCYGGLMASLGVVLGSIARTEGQAVGVGVLAANVLGALGGCWWPIEITPGWMQGLQLFLPTGWAMDALHKLISFGAGPASVVPHVLGMALGALALGWVATRLFRYQ